MTERSRAWNMGRDAARMCSFRKPPKGASEKWQAEYREGWNVGRAEVEAANLAWVRERAAAQNNTQEEIPHETAG